MPEEVMRHEIKYLIDQFDVLILRKRLNRIMKPDSYADLDGYYLVTSLYFDNDADESLFDKLDGIDPREKIRLRYYGSSPKQFKLEKKIKCAGLCHKQSINLDLKTGYQLMTGNNHFLLEQNDPVCHALYIKLKDCVLKPKTWVIYRREAYIFPVARVRVTIDRDVQSVVFRNGFFAPGLARVPADLDGLAILEVKYDQFLPSVIAELIQPCHGQKTALSKYALCRMHE